MCRAPTLEEKGQAAASAVDGVYTWRHPTPGLPWRSHFSSLLLSADVTSTLMELALLSSLTAASLLAPSALVDTPGSMPLRELALFMWLASALRKLYNAYLEAIYFARPAARTQPAAEHALKSLKDLNGRDAEQLAALVSHDRLTLLSQFALVLVAYRFLPGCYPSASEVVDALPVRAVKLLAHHYLLSFGMYWMHRSLHVIDPLWRHIHSIHHWAKHPLSRNTYQDHWLDNFGNALVGELLAQILVPIDHGCFWFSRLFRIMESLEKHSGVCGFYNLAHSLQRWMPYAQAPHHHDWHHEGHKSCNYTFAALGGVWDCLFGTRKVGRRAASHGAETAHDRRGASANPISSARFDQPLLCVAPLAAVVAAGVATLSANGMRCAW